MDAAGDFFAGEDCDHALDLPPVTEARHITVTARAARSGGGLEHRRVAIALDQFVRVFEGGSSVDEERVHVARLHRSPCGTNDEHRQRGVDYIRKSVCGAAMPSNKTRAGGCFLTICILAGFPLGLAIGNPMKGILIGTGVGIVLALLTWLLDLNRRR